LNDWIEVPCPASDVPGSAGLRLDLFLARRLHGYSRAAIQRMIVEERVLLPGRGSGPALRPVGKCVGRMGRAVFPRASTRIQEGDTVVLLYPRREDPPPLCSRITVLHEDAHLVVVDKPAGVLSHPTDKIVRNSVTAILAAQLPGTALHLGHRLDRETSGVLVLARDPDSARRLQEQFARREVSKEYLAVVVGRVPFESREVSGAIGRENGRIRVRQAVGGQGGDAAFTLVERVAVGHAFSLVRALPRTGRLHQIRVHLSSLGFPVAGDKLYLGDGEPYLKAVRKEWTPEDAAALGAPRQMLHARRITLRHPGDGERRSFAAPLPADMRELLRSDGMEADL